MTIFSRRLDPAPEVLTDTGGLGTARESDPPIIASILRLARESREAARFAQTH
jgi:hypothetical protein